MYLEHFKLKDHPFRLSPDPNYLFLSKQHSRAKAYIESTVWFADGFVIITGEIGSGKTILLERFLTELPDDVITARIAQTQITPTQLLQILLAEFGFKPFRKRKAELLNMLSEYLSERSRSGRKVVIIIDEAQNLTPRVLEEIRLISGIEGQKNKVLSIILAGQPELNEALDAQNMRQLTQRTRLRFHLGPLSEDEVREYVRHRLDVAGARGRKIFKKAAFDPIYKYTGGIPRLINTLCDTALIGAFADDVQTVTDQDIRNAVDELQWVEYAETTSRQRTMKQAEVGADSDADGRLAVLSIAQNGQMTMEFTLGQGRVIIGRTSDNDLQIDSKYISRHHAQIVSKPRYCVLEDLNSTNGIYVRSQRVKKHRLRDGDVIMIGKHELRYSNQRLSGND